MRFSLALVLASATVTLAMPAQYARASTTEAPLSYNPGGPMIPASAPTSASTNTHHYGPGPVSLHSSSATPSSSNTFHYGPGPVSLHTVSTSSSFSRSFTLGHGPESISTTLPAPTSTAA